MPSQLGTGTAGGGTSGSAGPTYYQGNFYTDPTTGKMAYDSPTTINPSIYSQFKSYMDARRNVSNPYNPIGESKAGPYIPPEQLMSQWGVDQQGLYDLAHQYQAETRNTPSMQDFREAGMWDTPLPPIQTNLQGPWLSNQGTQQNYSNPVRSAISNNAPGNIPAMQGFNTMAARQHQTPDYNPTTMARQGTYSPLQTWALGQRRKQVVPWL